VKAPTIPASVLIGFVGALVFGVALSVAFQGGHDDTAGYLFRAECVLGFVLGMTFTFGAVLPTLIGTIIATISAFVFFYVRPLLLRTAWSLRHEMSGLSRQQVLR
jgi:uncharacterized membrane protein YccC